jgi:hypothetical protein
MTLDHNGTPKQPQEYSIGFSFNEARNSHFTGREAILLKLHSFLQPPKPKALSIVVVHGIGGIGKTQLVLEYAHKWREIYGSIFRIDGTSENTAVSGIEKSLETIIRHCEMSGLVQNPRYHAIKSVLRSDEERLLNSEYRITVKELFIRWLSQNENRSWLLIIDNVDDLENFDFRKLLPWTISWGSVVVITRRSDLNTNWNSIEISHMDKKEAIDLLQRSSKVDLEDESQGKHVLELFRSLNP